MYDEHDSLPGKGTSDLSSTTSITYWGPPRSLRQRVLGFLPLMYNGWSVRVITPFILC
jgi:hypothetical protein